MPKPRALTLPSGSKTPERSTRLERLVVDDQAAFTHGHLFEVRKRDLQLDRTVKHVLRRFQSSYPATRVTLSELPIIHADLVIVHHVLVNVIGNAFKYSALQPQPAVEISLDTSGLLQVIDNGAGFAKKDAGKVFEPFVRLDPDASFPGVGLGLAAARRLLERHGGWIRADSREGGPTRFIISFES